MWGWVVGFVGLGGVGVSLAEGSGEGSSTGGAGGAGYVVEGWGRARWEGVRDCCRGCLEGL